MNATILDLEYVYTPHGLVDRIVERDALSVTARQTFTYDARGRLIQEIRDDLVAPSSSYNFPYEYDPGGNRTRKIESLEGCNRIETKYTYDISPPIDPQNPVDYLSKANRLMRTQTFETCQHFEDFDSSATCAQNPADTLVEESWYYYVNDNDYDQGNVSRVVTRTVVEGGTDQYAATRLAYALNGRAVAFVSGETWAYGSSPCPEAYTVTYAREFRYDSARERYLNRELDPLALQTTGQLVPINDTWSDYDGDEAYGDYSVASPSGNTTELASIEPGIGRVEWSGGVPDTASAQYYHTNMIGTTRMMTDSTGADVAHAAYTAFGEQRGGSPRRYGYAGAHGYQTDDTGAFPFQHLGARYYDPASGRFLQRDPIGINGGVNVYSYVRNGPTIAVDPDGQHPLFKYGAWEMFDIRPPSQWWPKRKPKPRPPEPRYYSEQDMQRMLEEQQMRAAACAILIGLTGVGGAVWGWAAGSTAGTATGITAGLSDIIAGLYLLLGG